MGLIVCFACGRQRQVTPIKRNGKYTCSNCKALQVLLIRSRRHGGLRSWEDKEGISEYEAKHQAYAYFKKIGERRGYKKGYAAVRFRELFGRWPNGEASESGAPATHDFLEAERLARAKYRKRKKEEELRLVPVLGGVCGGGASDAGSMGPRCGSIGDSLMTEDDWGVKL